MHHHMIRDLEQLQASLLDYLGRQQFNRPPQELYEPMAYILSLGGKRLRPLLALMGCQLFEREATAALPAALAVEIFHNFSLVHDDIMDQAPLRRGMPTVHEKYGLNAGILSGDVMLIEAYQYLRKCPADVDTGRLLDVFNSMAIEVCEGQARDMAFETKAAVALEDYLLMIEQKTAALIGAALALGAIVAGASDKDTQHLDAFGRNIGIAFQIQDDLLDTFGDPKKFGKQTGGDILQNKKTFLFLKALELANPQVQTQLAHLYQPGDISPAEKIDAVKRIFLALQVPAFAEKAKTTYQEIAMNHLHAIQAPAAHKAPIIAFAEMLFSREV
jgi:geranylgeranyl diphosphate synthase type II